MKFFSKVSRLVQMAMAAVVVSGAVLVAPGGLVHADSVRSDGCDYFAQGKPSGAIAPGVFGTSVSILNAAFWAGERLDVKSNSAQYSPQAQLEVYGNGVKLAAATLPNTLSYVIPANTTYTTLEIFLKNQGTDYTTLSIFCALAPHDVTINDTDPAITYTGKWMASGARGLGDYQNDVHATATAGDSFAYTFVGRGVIFRGEKSADQGKVAIFLDGTQVATVDTSAATKNVPQQVIYQAQGLSAGTHTLKVVNLTQNYWLTVDTISTNLFEHA